MTLYMTKMQTKKYQQKKLKCRHKIFIDFTEKLYKIQQYLDNRQPMNKKQIIELQNTILSRYNKE